jgi:hypothetical protein
LPNRGNKLRSSRAIKPRPGARSQINNHHFVAIKNFLNMSLSLSG